MSMQLLVDADEFWASLEMDIASSTEYVYLQTLSFEGDTVGQRLCDRLKAAAAPDIRVIVDDYTRYVMSDKFLYTPRNLRDKALRREVHDTWKMIDDLTGRGIKVKFVNPAGFCLRRFPARNHKKSVLIDDRIAYIGGINFSEHNFLWHDMMLRIEGDGVAGFFAEDFRKTWNGENAGRTAAFGNIEFVVFDGRNNQALFEPIMERLDAAKESICIESPYLTFPFFERLRKIRQRGVDVTIITPDQNNKKSIRRYILWESHRCGLTVQLYQGRMTHLKAILIDGRTLIMGSTNFDFLSYTLQQEIAAIITDPKIVGDFKNRIIAPDLNNSVRYDNNAGRPRGRLLSLQLKSLGKLAVFLNRL
jgi:cardiolipin synthase